jgi:hypothetical protein
VNFIHFIKPILLCSWEWRGDCCGYFPGTNEGEAMDQYLPASPTPVCPSHHDLITTTIQLNHRSHQHRACTACNTATKTNVISATVTTVPSTPPRPNRAMQDTDKGIRAAACMCYSYPPFLLPILNYTCVIYFYTYLHT